MTDESPQLHIVVEGIGKVVQKYYVNPLSYISGRWQGQISVTFTDESKYWQHARKETREENRQFIEKIKTWADYLDKSNSEDKKKLEKLKADVVFIATPDSTHVKLAKKWLKPPDRCKQIFIEKPLDASLLRARELVYLQGKNENKVVALDHYRARMLDFFINNRFEEEIIDKKLGGALKEISFYMLEDGTGDKHEGPIELEGRTSALKNGLILDMMPHALAIIDKFLPVELIEITGLKVGKYTFVKDNKSVEAGIPWETFGYVEFKYNEIKGKICVGKGVGGSEEFGKNSEVKLLEIVGGNGGKYRFDFRTPRPHKENPGVGAVTFIDRDGNESPGTPPNLIDDAYLALIDRIVRRNLLDDHTRLEFDLSVQKAKNFLIVLEDIRQGVKMLKRKLKVLPTYNIDKIKGAPLLEEITAELPEVLSVLSS